MTTTDEVLVGSLFSGYEGIGLGLKALFPQARLAFVSDIDPGACKVLAHRFSDVPNLGDVSLVDWTPWIGLIRVLTGGFPCQDVSNAGKRAGLMHGTRSGLWHEFARAIATLRPELVVIENVRGLLTARGDESPDLERAETRKRVIANLIVSAGIRQARAARNGRTTDAQAILTHTHRLMGLERRAVAAARLAERRIVRAVGTVLGTLADLGYDATWCGLRAADVGAPHGRFRVFVLAWPTDAPSDPGWVGHRNGLAASHPGGEARF